MLVMARPNSEQIEQPEIATIHVDNTMMTNDSMPYFVISAYPGIEIVQQYDFVVMRISSEGGIQRVISKWEPQGHESLIYCNGGFLGVLQKRSPNCKSNAMNATGNCGLATPEKCVTSSHFYKRTFIRKSGFTESSYVNIISGKFTGNERGATSSS